MNPDKPSILIVDDEPVNLKQAGATLIDYYELHFARNGEDALEYLANRSVDLILMDITMPGMDGFSVSAIVRNTPRTSNIPIIYLTGDNSEETIEKAFESGAADYITKPFRHRELLARVKNRIETEKLKRNLNISLKTNEHFLGIINNYVTYLKTDTQGIITEASPSFYEMFNTSENLIGQNINILKSGHTPAEVYKTLWETIRNGTTYCSEIENRNFGGGTNWYRSTIVPNFDDDGTLTGYFAFYTNIDEKIRYRHDAQTDYLTGLNNRAKFEIELTEEIYRAKRYAQPFALIMTDIDRFKEVNDTFGHEQGDKVLIEFAKILANSIRQSDILARWGGEEFIILCPHTETEGAAILAESLRAQIEAHRFDAVGQRTSSFGVASYLPGTDKEILFGNVDKALYTAKEQGRNRVIVFPDTPPQPS